MLLNYTFGPSVVKYDILGNNRRSELHAVIDYLFSAVMQQKFVSLSRNQNRKKQFVKSRPCDPSPRQEITQCANHFSLSLTTFLREEKHGSQL